jgi:hypothetical protein
MGKLCSLLRHTTFLLGGIAGLERKLVKNASQRVLLLFTGAEISANLPCSLCQIYGSKPPRAFGNLVEGKLLSNFCIQRLVHFCYKIGRKFNLKSVTWNCLSQSASTRTTSRHACHVGPLPYPHARTPRCRNTPQFVARRRGTVHLRPVTHANSLGRCHVASPHSPPREPPSAIGHRPAARRHRLHAHAVATVANEARAKLPWSTAGL